MKTFLQSLFGEEHSSSNYDDKAWEKKRKWVYEQEDKQKSSADWHYSQYLKRFYDEMVAKGKDEPYLLYKEFDEAREAL
jgi:hypothetical protein